MSSQIDALRKLGCRNYFQQEPLPTKDSTTEPDFVTQLPEPTILWKQVAVFLAEFGCYFPCLHEDKVCDQISTALRSLGYDDDCREVYVNKSQCQIIAFLFNILAYAEAVTQSFSAVGDIIPHPGAEHYFQGVKLMEHFGTIYFLDKRVAQKIGIAYSIRQSECAVREYFENDSSISTQAHHELLQNMISFGQLWAQIWDTFFSSKSNLTVRKEGNDDAWTELQLTDTKIILAYRRLPSRLH